MAGNKQSKVGRPRCFCEEQALEAAMRVFWEKGYEGASLSDLTEAMGINRPSLYAAFGDKESLFRRAMQQYEQGPASYIRKALEQANARAVLEHLLMGTVKLLADPKNPRGCLSVLAGLAGGDEAQAVSKDLADWRKQGETAIRKRLERAKAEGDLASDVNVPDLARYVVTVMTGLSVQAVNGATRPEMLRVAELALKAMPIGR